MKIRVPLRRFNEYVHAIQTGRKSCPHLDELSFLMNEFSFSDAEAIYTPEQPDPPLVFGPYAQWWFGNSRN